MDKEGEKGGNDDGETFGGEANLEEYRKAKDGLKNHRQRRCCEVNRSSSEKSEGLVSSSKMNVHAWYTQSF